MFKFGQVLKMKQSEIDSLKDEKMRDELPHLRLMFLAGLDIAILVNACSWGDFGDVSDFGAPSWWEVVDYDAR